MFTGMETNYASSRC